MKKFFVFLFLFSTLSMLSQSGFEDQTVFTRKDSLRMHYKTAFDEWTETVLEADDEMLKVKNENQVIYSYKKFQNKNLFEN